MKLKKITTSLLTFAAFAFVAANVTNAQTLWIGPDAGLINSAGNWNNGLPGPGNTGTFGVSANTVNYNGSLATGASIIQNGHTVTAVTPGTRNIVDSSWTVNGGSLNNAGVINLNGTGSLINGGGSISLTGATGNLQISNLAGSNGTFTNNSGTSSFNGLAIQFNGTDGTINVGGGMVTTGSLTIFKKGTLNVSGGTLTSTTTSIANTNTLGNFGAVNLTGGTFNAGALTVNRSTQVAGSEFAFSGDAKLTLSSLTFGGASVNYPTFDFSSVWSGYVQLTGATTLNDYWTAFEGTNNTFQLNNATINQTTFNNTFSVNGLNQLTIIPEPSSFVLLAAGLTLLIARRRRRGALA